MIFNAKPASESAKNGKVPVVRFVVASRESKERFFERTALGKCLRNFPIEIRLFEKNTKGLPARYNEAIEEARTNPAVLVFIHDDVFLHGFFFADEIIAALTRFDVVGIVGSKRRVPQQPSWAFLSVDGTRDEPENYSGIYGFGKGADLIALNSFGPPCQEVKLLDGFMIAAHSTTLIDKGVAFDERFDFHLYDVDFCRQAEEKGLTMGTWNISAIHEGNNPQGTPDWITAYEKYLDKWRS